MYVENVYNGFIYNLAHHRMSAIIRYLWARKYRAAVVSHGVPHQVDPVDVRLLCLGEKRQRLRSWWWSGWHKNRSREL